MSLQIIGELNPNQLYCAGSFSKLLTVFVCLSHLAERYPLDDISDDISFLDKIVATADAESFLQLFKRIIGSDFTIRDLCSYYSGLPYTFDLAEKELALVEKGHPFKHHSIPDEAEFLFRCANCITQVYPNRSKFHYSEIAILFLGYFIEKNDTVRMEDLYRKYVIAPFQLSSSHFSRVKMSGVLTQDLSPEYDYPAIAILDHGYFCYSNGYFTTLNDMKKLIENLLSTTVFQHMTNIKKARAASGRLLNGMAVEIRLVGDDVIYGYEGLSYSGCNIWAYSTKKQQGFVSFNNSEEAAYDIYDLWGYTIFDKVPDTAQTDYQAFLKKYDFKHETKNIPAHFQGQYQRVNINESTLATLFYVGANYIVIRNPDEIKYETVFANGHFCIKGKDGVHGGRVGFYSGKIDNKYMLYDGTLYKKI